MQTTLHASPSAGLPTCVLDHPTRDDRRVDLDGHVTLHYPDLGDSATERTQNVSATGMFVRTPALRPPGTVLHFELDLDNGLESIEGQAEVAWVRRHDDGLFRPAGMGARFLDLDQESQQLIGWSVAHRTRELRKVLHLDAVATEPVSDLDQLRTELEETLGSGQSLSPMLQGRAREESSALTELRAEVDVALKEILETSRGSGIEGGCDYLPGDADPHTLYPYAGCATARPPARFGSRLWRIASVPLVSLAALGIYLLSPVSEPASATPQAAQALAETLPAELTLVEIVPANPVPEPSTGSATEDRSSVAGDVEQLTMDWAEAWSEQRARAYLAFYSPKFQPPKGLDRGAWEATREERILKPRSIQVEISGLETEVLSPERARVSFAQTYRSDRYRDTVRKTFELAYGEDGWQILAERSEPEA